MDYTKKSLMGKKPYHSSYIEEGIILNANESAFDTPKEINKFLINYLENNDFKRYPDTDSNILRDSLAKKYNVKRENIAIGVGSDQLLDCIFRSTIDNDYVLTCNPTFSMYKEYGELQNAKMIEVDFNDDMSFNIEEIKNSIQKYNPKLVIVCSPNNPTGSAINRNDLESIIKLTKNLVIIDEAYGEFNDESNVDLATKYDNVIVLKTFSKAYALAGIRVGYAISKEKNIDTVYIIKPPYNIPTLSILAASYAISNSNLYDYQIKIIKENKEELYQELNKLSLNVKPSKANFLWVKLNKEVYDYLLSKKIYIRALMYRNENYYRITVGTKKENELLIKTLKEVL